MSSLAATQSDGFYFPPEWRPEFGGLSKYQGSKGANQYQTHGIIRFELPFDAWCLKCEGHMSKGLRFNAKKEKSPEKYFTTQIWSFSMKCPCPSCDQGFVIKTDPENDTYNMVEGMKKMEQDFVPDESDSIIRATTDEERNLLGTNPMYRLQHDKEDKQRASSAKEHLESLIDLQDFQKKKDYETNSLLRRGTRNKRKHAAQLLEEGSVRGLNFPLVEKIDADSIMAKSIKFSGHSTFSITERTKLNALQSQSIFGPTAVMCGHSSVSTPGRGSKSVISALSSEGRKQQRIHAAMATQSIVNIRTAHLKIISPPPSLSTIKLIPDLQKIHKCQLINQIQLSLQSDDSEFPVSKISSFGCNSRALNMLSIYSDDGND